MVDEHKREIASIASADLRPSFNFSRRIPELDGLRGIAIGMVLFFHFVSASLVVSPHSILGYMQSTTRFFWSGVDLFFVLSGFLIGGILLDARESPDYFKTFYIRRICRIFPIYILFIGLVGIAYRLVYRRVGAPLDFVFAGRLPWYSYLSFAQNLWMAKLNTVGATIMGSTWSLAVEEQFYLVLPFLIRFVRRSALPYVFISGIVAAPIARFSLASLYPTNLWTTSLLPCRMDPLLLGALCAYWLREPGVWGRLCRQRRDLWIVFFLMLPCLAISNFSWNSDVSAATYFVVTLAYSWLALFYTTMMLLALTGAGSFLSRMLSWSWLTGLGAVAYSVYLFHSGIYGFCMWLLAGHGWYLANWKDFGVTLLAVAITIAFGKLSWRYFEGPIVRLGHTWRY